MYMLGASVLMVSGAALLVLLALAPGVLAASLYLAFGSPAGATQLVWWAMAATPALAVLLAAAMTTRAAAPHGALFDRAEMRDAAGAALFGLLAAGLITFPAVAGTDGHGAL